MTGSVHGILAGYDGSPGSEQALNWAMREACSRGTVLTVCHSSAPGYSPSRTARVRRSIARSMPVGAGAPVAQTSPTSMSSSRPSGSMTPSE